MLNFQNPSSLLKSAKNSRFGMYLKLEQITQQIPQKYIYRPQGENLANNPKSCQICSNFKCMSNREFFADFSKFDGFWKLRTSFFQPKKIAILLFFDKVMALWKNLNFFGKKIEIFLKCHNFVKNWQNRNIFLVGNRMF